MAHLGLHAASVVPFVVMGNWPAAVGCLLPDLAWLPNEIRIQRAKPASPFRTIEQLTDREILPYRLAHSLVSWLLVLVPCAALTPLAWSLLAGVLVHIALDLPFHRGRLAQMPLYPIRWSWKWTLKK